MLEFLTTFFSNYQYFGLFWVMFFNQLIFTPPSEVILPVAGFYAFKLGNSLLWTIFTVTLASYIGTYIWYFVGRGIGYEWLFRFKFVRKRIDQKTMKRVFEKFRGEESYWVGIFRFVPFFRAAISIPAGMSKMNHLTFSVYSIIGLAMWNTAWVLWGYYFGSTLQYSWYITALFILNSVLVFLIFRMRMKRALDNFKK